MENQIKPWLEKIRYYSEKYSIPTYVIAGLVLQESSGNTYAIKCERGFFKKYFRNLKALITRTASRTDDRWFEYPEIFSASYGLCQVMYPVALEHGFNLRFPTELCDPDIGLDAGCKHLRKHLTATNENLVRALQRYNGGGDLLYATKVLDKGNAVKHLL